MMDDELLLAVAELVEALDYETEGVPEEDEIVANLERIREIVEETKNLTRCGKCLRDLEEIDRLVEKKERDIIYANAIYEILRRRGYTSYLDLPEDVKEEIKKEAKRWYEIWGRKKRKMAK